MDTLNCLLIFSLALSVTPSIPDGLSGSWAGTLIAPPNDVPIGMVFDHDGNAWSGSFSLPTEGIQDLPLHAVELEEARVVVHLTPERVFRGRLMGDSLPGHLVFHDRGGVEVEMVLYREGAEDRMTLQKDGANRTATAWKKGTAALPDAGGRSGRDAWRPGRGPVRE